MRSGQYPRAFREGSIPTRARQTARVPGPVLPPQREYETLREIGRGFVGRSSRRTDASREPRPNLSPSIFLDFNLPNSATWFYFSLLLTVALFIQFFRPLTLRNL